MISQTRRVFNRKMEDFRRVKKGAKNEILAEKEVLTETSRKALGTTVIISKDLSDLREAAGSLIKAINLIASKEEINTKLIILICFFGGKL